MITESTPVELTVPVSVSEVGGTIPGTTSVVSTGFHPDEVREDITGVCRDCGQGPLDRVPPTSRSEVEAVCVSSVVVPTQEGTVEGTPGTSTKVSDRVTELVFQVGDLLTVEVRGVPTGA